MESWVTTWPMWLSNSTTRKPICTSTIWNKKWSWLRSARLYLRRRQEVRCSKRAEAWQGAMPSRITSKMAEITHTALTTREPITSMMILSRKQHNKIEQLGRDKILEWKQNESLATMETLPITRNAQATRYQRHHTKLQDKLKTTIQTNKKRRARKTTQGSYPQTQHGNRLI